MAGNRKTSREKQPVNRHPLFPAVAALWFGALFGLGSLAIRPSLLEEVVVASGIDLLIPAAAPPLGVTARILLALMLASFGSLIGFALGTRVARPKVAPVQRRRSTLTTEEPALPRRADRFTVGEVTAPKPLSAFDELGQEDRIEPVSAPPACGSRRRALAMEEPTAPDYARDYAPLPGGSYPVPTMSEPEYDDVLDLADPMPEDHFAEATLRDEDPFAPAPLAAATPEATLRQFERVADPAETSASAEAASAEPADDRPLPPRNPGLRFAAPQPANEAGQPPAINVPAAAPAASEAEPVTVAAAVSAPAAPLWSGSALGSKAGNAAEHLRTAPLDSLSQIELIERLALSLQERRVAPAAPIAAPAAVAAPAPEPAAALFPPVGEMPRFGFEPRMPVEIDLPSAPVAQAAPVAAVEPAAAAIPAAMRPIDFSGFDDDEDEAAPAIPRFPFVAAPAVPAVPTQPIPATAQGTQGDDADQVGTGEESFSSLLDLGRAPLRQPLVRIEEPGSEIEGIEPVVVFPGHGSRPFASPAPTVQPAPPAAPSGTRPFDAPPAAPASSPAASIQRDPEETEQALRAALATLQRMSGAA